MEQKKFIPLFCLQARTERSSAQISSKQKTNENEFSKENFWFKRNFIL